MKLGDWVKITVNDIDYLARLVSYNSETQEYGCSVYALGEVILAKSSDIEAL